MSELLYDIQMSTIFLSVCLLLKNLSTLFLSLCLLLKMNAYNYFVHVSPFEKYVYTFLSVSLLLKNMSTLFLSMCLLLKNISTIFLSVCLLLKKNVYTFFVHVYTFENIFIHTLFCPSFYFTHPLSLGSL